MASEQEPPASYAVGYIKGGQTRLVSPYLGETLETVAEAEDHWREELEYVDCWLFEVRPVRHLGVSRGE